MLVGKSARILWDLYNLKTNFKSFRLWAIPKMRLVKMKRLRPLIFVSSFALFLTGCNTVQPIKSVNPPRSVVGVIEGKVENCKLSHNRLSRFRYYQYPANDYKAFTGNRHLTTMNLVWSMHAVTVQMLNPETRDELKYKEWLKKFTKALQAGYYSEIKDGKTNKMFVFGDGKGTPDPSYGAQIALLAASYLVSITDQFNLWESGQRQVVIDWGNKLYPLTTIDRKQRSLSQQSKDNVAMRALAYSAWGLVSGAEEPLVLAEKAYREGIKPIKDDGEYLHWLLKKDSAYSVNQAFREDDKTVGFLILSAHFAMKAGFDFYNLSNGRGKTIHDAVDWLLKAHFEPEKTRVADRLIDQAKMGDGMDVNDWAWTVIYASDFRTTDLGTKIEKLSLSFKPYGGYYHSGDMGPLSCLYDAS